MKRIHIFKAGTHTAMNGRSLDFSEADLAAVARAYDPKVHEAPLVIGHPKHDLPAYGWVKGLAATGEGLFADPDQVDAEFQEMVEGGKFKKISASFYLPDASGNPVPGSYYLRHVGFLGAQPPAVKGLKGVEFAADEEGTVSIEFGAGPAAGGTFGEYGDRVIARLLRNLKNFWIEKFGKEEADQLIDEWDLQAVTEEALIPETTPEFSEHRKEVDMTPEQLKQKEAELAAREAKLKEQQASFAEGERVARRKADADYAARLAKEGKILPTEEKFVCNFLEAIEGQTEATVQFGEGEKASPRDAFCQFLEARGSHPLFKSMVPPKQESTPADVNFGEGLTSQV